MAAIDGLNFGQQLCKILKLDSSKTQSIVISVKNDDAIKVHVIQYLQQDEANAITDMLKNYQLEPNPNAEDKDKPDGETLVNFMQ